MKNFLRLMFVMVFVAGVNHAQAQTENEPKDYLIVVSNSNDKAANQKVLDEVKANHPDAGMYYDDDAKQYYVFIERYYVKSGADYAVWWHKKETKNLPKVWAKAVTPGTGA